MNNLKKRREKVERLTEQARKSNIFHKYRQGLYILERIAMREIELIRNCTTFLTN
jgi:hypothetical protein